MARTVLITDITPKAGHWPNLLDATIPGVPNAQVARVIASCNDSQERIAIVFSPTGQSRDRAAVVDAVRAHLKDFHLGYVESNEAGTVHLWTSDVSRSEMAFLTAAAAAVLQCSWGWDESPSIRVSAGDQSFCFQVQANGDRNYNALELTAA